MKVLFATTYIYNPKWKEFTKNKTGFGFMVNSIFQAVATKVDIVLISHVFTAGHKNIAKHSIFDVIRYSCFRDWIQGIRWAFNFRNNIKGRIQYLYYCVNKGYVRYIIKQEKPNLIHIHGIGYETRTYIEVCEELKYPYVVTLHGLIGFSDSVLAKEWDKKFEREFILSRTNIVPTTVISTGMKKKIEDKYLGITCDNIRVITNGTEIKTSNYNCDNVLKNYNIPFGLKKCVVIGSICKRKNQVQILRVIELLKKIYKREIILLVCGNDTSNGEFDNTIKSLNIESNVIKFGFVMPKLIHEILRECDLNIVASIDEGFGLSIIEGFSQGTPTVTFNDLDAVEDLYNPNAMILCDRRDDEAFAAAIEEGLKKEWDKSFIKKYAKKFDLDSMANNYFSLYKEYVT